MYRKSEVQCERLFSSSGYIVNKTRSSLEANTVNMFMCLRIVGYPSTFERENTFATTIYY